MQFNQAKLLFINIVVLVVGIASGLQLQSPEPNNDGFLARLHRLQLNQPIESISDLNSNPSINSIGGASESNSHAVWNQIRQRQKQLQRLQNYFGPEVLASIDQLQSNQDVPSVSALGKHVDMPSVGPRNQFAYPIDTIEHALPSPLKMLPSPYQMLTKSDDVESIDKLRKYHFQGESGEESPFALKSQAQMNAFDQLLQDAENEKQGNSYSFNPSKDENLIKNRLDQLFANSNKYQNSVDRQINNDQLAALLRHAPLEAILAEAQEEANQQRHQLAEVPQTAHDQSKPVDLSLMQQMPMKKQAETNQGEVESMQTDEQQPQHFKTQLKKVEISQQDGKQLRKEESYEQSVQVSPVTSKNVGANAIDSIASHDAEPSHMEQSSYQVRAPISVQLRNDPSATGPAVRSLTSKLTSFGDLYFLMLVVGCSMASIMSVVGAGICFYRFQQHHKATADVDYPAYGVIGPVSKPPISPGAQQPLQVDLKNNKGEVRKTNESLPTGEPVVGGGPTSGAGVNSTDSSNNDAPNGDRKLAQSAQMYHYQHQKQQMIASEKNTNGRNTSTSDVESEEENEEGDYTVYECPGLASTGEIEVTNPLFQHSP